MKKVLFSLLSVAMIALFLVSCAGGGGEEINPVISYLEEMVPVNDIVTSVSWSMGGDLNPVLRTFENTAEERASENEYITFINEQVDQKCVLDMNVNLSEDSVISFNKKHTTGSNVNEFRLFIDGNPAGIWYWYQNDSEVVRRLSAGEHNIRWEYSMGYAGIDGDISVHYAAINDIEIDKLENYDLGNIIDIPDENLKNAILSTIGLAEVNSHQSRSQTFVYDKRELLLKGNMLEYKKTNAPRGYKRVLANNVYSKEVKDLMLFEANDCNIQNLQGINELANLNHLSLANNKISDVSYLGELNSLYSLNLGGNSINSIDFLGSLPFSVD